MVNRGVPVAVAAAGVAGAALALWSVPRAPLTAGLVLFVAAALAEASPVRLRNDFRVSLSSLAVFVGILVGGAHLAVVASAGAAAAVAWRAGDRRIQRALYNWGQLETAAMTAGVLYVAFGGQPGVLSGASVLPLAASVVAYTVVNHLAVAVIIRLASGERLLSTLRSIRSAVLPQVAYAAMSFVAAGLVLHVHPVALVALIVPIFIASSGLRGFEELERSYERLVRTIAQAIELKDPYTFGHAERVAELADAVAERLDYAFEERRTTRYAALLHDIGKVAVPTEILTKAGPLTDDEYVIIQTHPELGADILSGIDFLAPSIGAVRWHHERLDGRGYPSGLTADELPEVARIVAVVDAFDALTSTRPYREAWDIEPALRELHRCAGTQFDPDIVALLSAVVADRGWEPSRTPHMIGVDSAKESDAGADGAIDVGAEDVVST